MTWQLRSRIALTVLGVLCGNLAAAEEATTARFRPDVQGSVEVAVYQAERQDTPAREELAAAPPLPAEIPALPIPNQTVPAPLPPDAAYDSPAAALSSSSDVPDDSGDAWIEDDSGRSFARSAGAGCRAEKACGVTSCMVPPCGARCGNCGGFRGINLGGWLAQGITVNGRKVADRFNGPIGFNDRDAEYQMNQLWLFAEKELDTRPTGFDVGGRVDVLYGTDWRFTASEGLEDDWNQSERFYGLALPQMYLDVGIGDLAVRMGHYYTIIGYEVVTAPDNFFYSHSYAMLYGEPFTHTGLLASYALGDQWTVSAGFDRGWDTWEDNNNDLAVLGGIRWEKTVRDEKTSLAVAVSSGPYDDRGEHNRSMYSVVFSRQVGPLKYVLQHDYGIDDNGAFTDIHGAVHDAEWYGINQYVFYDINPCWGLGVRAEWFRDDDGARVGGIGAPHGWTLGPNHAANQPGWAGSFTAVTAGINWRPTDCITVRPEWRWDWYSGRDDGLGRAPYDFGTQNTQFTFGTDVILVF